MEDRPQTLHDPEAIELAGFFSAPWKVLVTSSVSVAVRPPLPPPLAVPSMCETELDVAMR